MPQPYRNPGVRQFKRLAPSFAPGIALSAILLALIAILLWQLLALGEQRFSFWQTLGSRDWRVVRFTAFQAGLSVALSLAVGIPLAWALSHQHSFPGRAILVAILSSALVLPTLVVVLGLITLLGRNGWVSRLLESATGDPLGASIYGLAGILVAHTYLNGSLAARAMLNRLEAIPAEKRKLVRSLDLSAAQRFAILEWPAIRSTIPAISVTIFLLCFTSFAIVLTLGGSPRYNTLEVAIFEAVKLEFDIPRALDLATLQLAICAVLVIFSPRLSAADMAISSPRSFEIWPERFCARILQITLITTLSIGFLFPLVAVMVDGLQAEYGRLLSEPSFQRSLLTSLIIATASSSTAVIFALMIAAARRNFTVDQRLGRSIMAMPTTRLLSFSATLYLAFPSLVLGLGFFLLSRRFAGSMDFWAAIALLLANVLMALPFAVAILAPAMEKTAQRYDRLSFSLGLSTWARWRTIEWPLLRPDIGYAAAIAFCLSLGDLGVIALFGNQNFTTLPWLLYQKLGSYRTDDAAGIAFIMLAIMLLAFFALPKLFGSRMNGKPANASA